MSKPDASFPQGITVVNKARHSLYDFPSGVDHAMTGAEFSRACSIYTIIHVARVLRHIVVAFFQRRCRVGVLNASVTG